ncbi:MAG: hypothetical protein ACREPI_05470 [Candidatus Dormibacterales bacterium]
MTRTEREAEMVTEIHRRGNAQRLLGVVQVAAPAEQIHVECVPYLPALR